MNLNDLRAFLAVARQQSLVAAADRLHLTPSAVSKALKRLEDDLGVTLFDRSTRQLKLNVPGQRLVDQAQRMLALADQARADLRGGDAAIDCRIGGPAVLLWRDGSRIADALAPHPNATLRLLAMFEDDALAALARGEIDAALVTDAVVDGKGQTWSPDWHGVPLGALAMHLVAGRAHPLVAARDTDNAATCHALAADVLAHAFACPTRSMFCGQQRGPHADGWRDDVLPRRIRYWTDDLQLLLTFVRKGAALAYLPEAAVGERDIVRIHVDDCPFVCSEACRLVWNRHTAPAWLSEVGAALAEAGVTDVG